MSGKAEAISRGPADLMVARPSVWRKLRVGPWSSALVLGAALLILFARRPDAFLNPQFWAEDGNLFFFQSQTMGLAALWEAYAGYLHLMPRLIAAAADRFDPLFAPAIFVGCSIALTLYVASRALSPRFPFRPRAVAALITVLVPDMGETLANVTNLQSVLAVGLIAVLISDEPRRSRERLHDACAILLIGLTGPYSLLLAPAFILRASVERTRWSWVVAITVAALGAVQGWLLLRHPAPIDPAATIQAWHGLGALGMRTGGSLLIGQMLPRDPPLAAMLVLGFATLGAIGCLALRPGGSRRARGLLGLAWACLAIATLYRCRHVLPYLCHEGYGSRYFFPLRVIPLWLLVAWLGSGAWRPALFGSAILAISVATNLGRLREPALRDYRWADYVEKIRNGEAVVVPINPEGWTITLPARPQRAKN